MPRVACRYPLGLFWGCLFVMGGLVVNEARPADIDPEHAKFFEREVRPLLAERCFKCHGDKKQSGGLRLDIRANAFAGGESGPAVVPGELSESLLIDAINYESYEMPPDGKLAAKDIAILQKWVEIGAPWPGDDRPAATIHTPGVITEEDRKWWAIQPIQRPNVPSVPAEHQDWVRNDVDRFVVQKLVEQGLAPAPQTDRRALIRRVTFDLIGLPPSPEEIEAFVNDPSPDAYERLVENLLERPQYGERWARHWLDLVRYADSDGYRADGYRPHAWRYRDYVIQAFNDDKPYDRFVQEQLAGDELFPEDPAALTATGFLRHWIYEYNNRDARGQWEVIMNDITDTTADVFMGVGLQCARCHDHKFDPLMQADYFRLQSFFAAMLPRDDLHAATAAEQQQFVEALQPWEAKTASIRAQIAELEAAARKSAERSAISKFPEDVQAMMLKPEDERTPYEHQVAELANRQVYFEYDRLDGRLKADVKDQVLALRKELASFDKLRPRELPKILAVTDMGPHAADVFIPKKGKTPVEPGYLTILSPEPADITPIPGNPQTTGRRATLAKWLTSRENPLTSRVIVNRLWQQHFGRGLAVNTSDFGRLGEAPSHPELLDWLASELMDRGWSLKQMHRLMVLSATYQQSADHPQAELARITDPENRLLWSGSVRRLDSEQIRDALYAITGRLKESPTGQPSVANEQAVRSIYLRFMRNQRNPLLDVFDVPFGITSTSNRHITTTPIQALLLINSQFMLQQATAFEQRLNDDAPAGAEARIHRAYELLFGRPADEDELTAAQDFLADQVRRIDVQQADSEAAKFEYGKIPFRDGQAALLTPAHPPMRAKLNEEMLTSDFTVEAFIMLRSIYPTGTVRVIASSWDGSSQKAGWAFGITGKGSRRKPQTLVMQIIGPNAEGKLVEGAMFSDHTIELNKPYYVAAAVRYTRDGTPGVTEFYVKDLSNDDEPLLKASVENKLHQGIRSQFPLTIGGKLNRNDARFDGLIDDVRISKTALTEKQLLYSTDAPSPEAVGFWRFESEPNVFADASGHGHDLHPVTTDTRGERLNAERQAWIDLCHVLLNSNEFLYVR